MSDDNTMDSVMIDLETMATGPNAGVIQVGAIPFNSRTGLVEPDLFEVDVDLHSALMLGGEVDASTVQFWRDQGGLQPKRPPKAMRSALTDLARWLGKYPDLKRVWAQGPSFDVAILEGYYRRAGVPIPWGYSMARDTRTVYDLAKERGWSKPEGTQAVHTSLEDCRRQIICLMSALNVLRGNPEENPRLADEIDLSNDRILHDTDREVARIAEAAARIPPGEPGDCDLCGEWSGRLVGGVCAPCRDRHGLP